MSIETKEKIFKAIEEVFNSFNQKEIVDFNNLIPSMLPEKLAVVYAIFDKNTQEALYVGRTKDLRRRLYTNHLMGNTSTARLKKYIVEDNIKFPDITTYKEAKNWIRENCYFKYMVVADSKERGHIEGLLSFVLNSHYIEDEH